MKKYVPKCSCYEILFYYYLFNSNNNVVGDIFLLKIIASKSLAGLKIIFDTDYSLSIG